MSILCELDHIWSSFLSSIILKYSKTLQKIKGIFGKAKFNPRAPLDNVKSLWGKSPEEIAKAFKDAGYDVSIEASIKGSKLSTQIRIRGHPQLNNIQVHPGGGRHGGAYYKLSTSKEGIIKVVDKATYKATTGEKATIIYK